MTERTDEASRVMCLWCVADYPDAGRCPRCGQPERTCNEIAGRAFRRSWDPRLTYDLEVKPPRMPATRCLPVLVGSPPWQDMSVTKIAELLKRQLMHLCAATCVPRRILLGEAEET